MRSEPSPVTVTFRAADPQPVSGSPAPQRSASTAKTVARPRPPRLPLDPDQMATARWGALRAALLAYVVALGVVWLCSLALQTQTLHWLTASAAPIIYDGGHWLPWSPMPPLAFLVLLSIGLILTGAYLDRWTETVAMAFGIAGIVTALLAAFIFLHLCSSWMLSPQGLTAGLSENGPLGVWSTIHAVIDEIRLMLIRLHLSPMQLTFGLMFLPLPIAVYIVDLSASVEVVGERNAKRQRAFSRSPVRHATAVFGGVWVFSFGGNILRRDGVSSLAAASALLQHSATWERRRRGLEITDEIGQLVLCRPYEGGGYIVEEKERPDGSAYAIVAYDVTTDNNRPAFNAIQTRTGNGGAYRYAIPESEYIEAMNLGLGGYVRGWDGDDSAMEERPKEYAPKPKDRPPETEWVWTGKYAGAASGMMPLARVQLERVELRGAHVPDDPHASPAPEVGSAAFHWPWR